MYNKVLNEKVVAGDIVDRLREHTNAPLSSCVDAARAVFFSISEYVSDENFQRIASAIQSFEVDINNSRDKIVLDLLVKRLLEIFGEKEELSYSVSQDDAELIDYLNRLADIANKTDPRITYSAVSFDDYNWLNSLINLFQMDQNEAVHDSVIRCLDALTKSCPKLAVFLMESKLPVVIAFEISTPPEALRAFHISSLIILTRIFSSSGPPPLNHFDTINSSFVEKIVRHIERSDDQTKLHILNCLTAINKACSLNSENPVMEGLKTAGITSFGELFISDLNKQCTRNKLKLLQNIAKSEKLFDDLFYTNDVVVLKHVLARELINNEDEKIRDLCFEIISEVKRNGVSCNDIEEAISLYKANLI